MTIQQLVYITEIQKHSSISAAARNLFVSQSVISIALKKLEEELDFTIFKRNNKKLEVTEQGYILLAEARKIISTCNSIKEINKDKSIMGLKILSFDYSLILSSFKDFVKNNENSNNTNFSFKNCEFEQIIEGVINREADLGFLVIPSNTKLTLDNYINNKLLSYELLIELPMCIKLRKNHPALNNKETFFDGLYNYKLIHFRNENFYPHTSDTPSFVNSQNTIYLNDRDFRSEIVNETNAYMIGIPQTKEYKKRFDFEEVLIDNYFVKIMYIYHKNKLITDNMKKFITILNDKVKDEFTKYYIK